MNQKNRLGMLVAVCLATGSAVASAGDMPLDLSVASANTTSAPFMVLAANDVAIANQQPAVAVNTPVAEFEPPLLSGSNAHQYLGLATIGLAALTGMTAPGECESAGCASQPREINGTHAKLAYATVAAATATVVTGLVTHWDDFYTEDGWTDPDNLHVLLGTAGAALMGYATYKSAQVKTGQYETHAGMAQAGTLGMVAAIVLTW